MISGVGLQRVDRPHGQDHADAEGHRGRVPHLDAGGIDGMRQTLAAPIRRPRDAIPASGTPVAIGLLPTVGRRDHAVLDPGALTIANPVKRGNHLGREPSRLLQHGIDQVLVEVFVEPFGKRSSKSGGVFEREGDVGNRRAIGHAASPPTLRSACEVHATSLTASEALRVPGERSETRDPGPKLANSTNLSPWVPALTPATPPLRPGHARLVTPYS